MYCFIDSRHSLLERAPGHSWFITTITNARTCYSVFFMF